MLARNEERQRLLSKIDFKSIIIMMLPMLAVAVLLEWVLVVYSCKHIAALCYAFSDIL